MQVLDTPPIVLVGALNNCLVSIVSQRIAIRSPTGGWLRAADRSCCGKNERRVTFRECPPTVKGLASLESDLEDCEVWTLEFRGNGRCALKACDGSYLCCVDGFEVSLCDGNHKDWEEWFITEDENEYTDPWCTLRNGLFGSAVAAGALLTAGALAVPLAGFTTSGVAAGSLAASVQSTMYGAYTSGAFSVFQSWGATAAWAAPAQVGVVFSITGTTGILCNHFIRPSFKDSNPFEWLEYCRQTQSALHSTSRVADSV